MRVGVVPLHYVENERRYGLRVDIKNFSMPTDVGREESLVMLNNSRKEEAPEQSFGGMETVLTRQMELSKW